MQLLWMLSPFLMKPNVFLDHFRRHLVLHRPSSDLSPKYPLPILRCPYQMILRVVYTVATFLWCHTSTLQQTVLPFRQQAFFIPALPGRGIQMPSLVKGMLKDLRRVRDGKELEEDHLLKLLAQIDVDALGPVTQSLRDELQPANPRPVDPGIRNTSIMVTTIQSSKGLSADYVFITHIDDLYCVRDKDAGISDQDVCSFLVALTRARRKAYLLYTDNAQTPTFLTWIVKSRICEVKSPGAGNS